MTKSPTIYAMSHTVTKHLYIGSTFNMKTRRKKWREHIRKKTAPPVIIALSPPDAWEFRIVEVMPPDTTPDQLAARERAFVARLRIVAPERLLNRLLPTRSDIEGIEVNGEVHSMNEWSKITGIPRATLSARMAAGWTPAQVVGKEARPERDFTAISDEQRAVSLARQRIIVLAEDGAPMLLSEAATVLGTQRDTLSERLRRWEASGRTHMHEGKPAVKLADLV